MRARRSPSDTPASGLRFLVVLALGVLIVGFVGMLEGPRVVRQVLSMVGLRKVESHAEAIRFAARESGVDACLLAGIMYVESRGRMGSVSDKGALGLFQLMPAAANDAARKLGLPEPTREALLGDELYNTRLGAAHLAWLIKSEDDPNLERVLAGYNAGRAKLQRWIRDAGSWEAWRAEQLRADTSGAFGYAQSVLEYAGRFRERGVIVPLPAPVEAPSELARPLQER